MSDVDHLLITINANGDGPAKIDEMVGYACWCGVPTCMRWLTADRARVWDEAVEATAAAIGSDPRRPRWTWAIPDNPYEETP